ncbi:hypothetical protein [Paucibacter soli]|uniref:hypothetical protein n=1 Tax=Paucibacter soli TaxID=3133433 RepID=UPI003099D8B1
MTSLHAPTFPNGAHDIEKLLSILGQYQLDPSMNRIEHEGCGVFRFQGNFLKLSHAFQVRSNDADLVVRLYEAITANRSRADYLADVAYREGAALDYHAGLQATGNDEAFRSAKREWAAVRPHVAGMVAGDPNIDSELAARMPGHQVVRVVDRGANNDAVKIPACPSTPRRSRP